MRRRLALELIRHAARWSSNNMVELGSNYCDHLTDDVARRIHEAHVALNDLGDACAFALHNLESEK